MPTTPIWSIPYPDDGVSPDIPRDVKAVAGAIDAIPWVERDEPTDHARAYIWVGSATGGEWRALTETWAYDEKAGRWGMTWYGPLFPRLTVPVLAPASVTLGHPVTASGSVTDQRGVAITEGIVGLVRRDAAGVESVVGTATPDSQGCFSITDPGVSTVGAVFYRFVYAAPSIRYESGQSLEQAVEVGLGTVSGLRYNSYTAASCSLTWNPVAGSDGYEVQKYEQSGWVTTAQVVAPPSGTFPLAAGETPRWRVRAFKNGPGGVPVYGPFSNELHRVDTGTTISAVPAASKYGDSISLQGTVLTVTGAPVTVGTVEILLQQTTGGAWQSVRTVSVVNGVWSTPHVLGHVGSGTKWKAVYQPPSGAAEQGSSVESNVATVGIGDVGVLASGSASHTSCVISWAAVPGATRYEIGNGTTVISGGVLGDVTSKSISVAQNTQYSWRVRAGRQDQNGNWVYGGWSPILYFNSGRPETRDQGSAWVRRDCVGSGSHRIDNGWNSVPYVRQGFFSSPYAGAGYVGIFDYGDWGLANAIINQLGRARYDNGSSQGGYLHVYKRGDVGNTQCCSVHFYSGTSWVGGPRPGLYRHGVSAYLCYNTWNRINLPPSVTDDIAFQRGGSRNIAVYSGAASEYTALNNHTAGADDGDLFVLWAWNFVTAAYVAPRWWR